MNHPKKEVDYQEFAKRQIAGITETLTKVMFGDFTAVARTDKPDETFGYLCVMINVAINSARNAQEELSAARRELELRVQERTADLANANARLKGEMAERKQAEETLRAAEKRYRTLVETMNHGIGEIDSSGKITYGSPALHRIYEYDAGGLIGKSILDIVATEPERNHLREFLKKLITEQPAPAPYVGQKRTKRGRVIAVQVDWNYKRDNAGQATGFISIITDITERRRAEENVRRLAEILETATDFVGTVDEKGIITYMNPAGRTMLGIALDEDISQMNISNCHPKWAMAQISKESFPAAVRQGVWMGESAFLGRDGREIPVSMALIAHKTSQGEITHFSTISRDITERRKAAAALETSRQNFISIVEMSSDGILLVSEEDTVLFANGAAMSLLGKKGKDLIGKPSGLLVATGRTVQVSVTGEGGKPAIGELQAIPTQWGGRKARLITLRDISERKEMERRVMQSEKMSVVGQLAAGVAHELNNPLGIILGFAQSAAKRVKKGDSLSLPLRSIERESLRCKALVKNLLQFSRQSTAENENLELNEAISSAILLIETQARVQAVEVEWEPSPDPIHIIGDKTQLQQVIMNLATNALDSMEDGGTLKVAVQRKEEDRRTWAQVSVSDNGVGIPSDIREKIFEPFFTTKEPGKGTGLGLSMVYEIVRRHRGGIECRSKEGWGTTFIVTLPLEEDPA